MKKQRQNKKSIVIGITGSFGSGKSTVAGIFKSYGAKVLDADVIAHGCISPGSSAYKKIIRAFGKRVLKNRKIIDRRKLADIVFGNVNYLIRLNNIIHPQVIRIIKNKIKSMKSEIIVLDAPLLLEAGLERVIDKLIVVNLKRDKQIARLKIKTSLGREDILKRIKQQIPLREKIRLADFVIDNNGNKTETAKQARQIWRSLWKN